MKTDPSTYHMWQIKLLLLQIYNHNKRVMDEMKIDGQDVQNEPLISTEFTLAIKQRVGNVFDGWEIKIIPYLRKYLGLPSSRRISSCDEDMKKILSSYLVYHDLPRGVLKNVMSDNELGVMMELENMSLSVDALSKIELLLR